MKIKKSILCRIGLHKYEHKTSRNGYVDIGDNILCTEEAWIGCVRENCNKVKNPKKSKWIVFRKE